MEISRASMLGLVLLAMLSHTVLASDPDLTTDEGIVPTSVLNFTFTGFRNVKPVGQGVATPTFATFQNLPGLTGLGLTAVLFEFGPESQISPHIHPRATGNFLGAQSVMLVICPGTVDVGFVDTASNLFETTLQTGDLFVFPKGTLHFQRNNYGTPATGFSALSSENPGLLSASAALFTAGGTGLPDNVLSNAFQVSVNVIEDIKHALKNP